MASKRLKTPDLDLELYPKLHCIIVCSSSTEKQFFGFNGYHGDSQSNSAVTGVREYFSIPVKPATQKMEMALTEDHRAYVQGRISVV